MTGPRDALEVSFSVNGKRREALVAANRTLADFLREDLGLTGCKIGCDAGVCGACTVLINERPAAACSTFVFELEDATVLTVEGLGTPDQLDPIQQAFLDKDAFQCGFCTPGMMLAAKALLAVDPTPSNASIRQWLQGNICRCTGYQMIIEAVQHASQLRRTRENES